MWPISGAYEVIRQFPKNHDEQLSQNFWLREFHCQCRTDACKTTYISEELIEGLQAVRDLIGPILVLSGFRCRTHNESVGGKADSKHLLGIAADITGKGISSNELKKSAQRVLVFSQGGIGVYHWGVHCDVRGTPARWIG